MKNMSVSVSEKPETANTVIRAFVSIRVRPSFIDDVAGAISNLDGIDQLYEATGESELISLISMPGMEEFREVKNRIMMIKGVLATGVAIVERI